MPFHGRFEFTEKTRHKLLSQAVRVRLLSQANDLKRTRPKRWLRRRREKGRFAGPQNASRGDPRR